MPPRKRRRTDGRFAVTIRYVDPITGEKRRGYFYGRTQAEAKARAEEARQRLSAGAPVRDASRTLAEWLHDWRDTFLRVSDRAAATKRLYEGITRLHVEPLLGSITLDRLKPIDVTRLLLAMEQAGLSASTRRNAYAALRGALDDAVRNGLIASNPAAKVKRPRPGHHEARSLTPEEVGRLLAASANLRYFGALKVILGTGMRRGEVLALRWQDVDFDRAEAKIVGSLVREGGRLTVSTPKTARSRRVVCLSPAVVALLKAQRVAQARERLIAGDLWQDQGFVFTTELGRPVDPRNLLRTVRVCAKQVGLGGNVGVHTLRHTYATTALLNNVPLHVVSRNLGHSSIAVTADIYGHLTDAAAQGAAEAVAAALGL